ncbi:MAG TPA: thymidine phosphorylase [candidate division Zixibacteria bacterium]|jgi:pyrimidine-nucleoside phosphorylase|nr:thymidine phosphorylase [candidate division Zixibacteria bacterium]
MTPYEIIYKKRNGEALDPEEIGWFVAGYTAGRIPDYQAAALLMAVFLKGMDFAETTALALAMMNSGRVFDLSEIPGTKVDKHSTGGVGDKVSIILAPIVAAAGVPVPMVSGRGLGHTGGTLDKLESIPGFRTGLSFEEFRRILARTGLAMMGQTADMAPADKKLYALRDVTATVDCIPLIAASIMSKKLAEGTDGLVLDVKTGSGAFMRTLDDSRKLAETMAAIGKGLGKRMRAVITDMSQPLGRAVGNALEIEECVECLRGGGPDDLMAVTYRLGAEMLVMGERANDLESGERILRQIVSSGQGLEKFREMVSAQGGDPKVADDPKKIMAQAKFAINLKAGKGGYVNYMDTREIGMAGVGLGCGRLGMEDRVDPAVGFVFNCRIGDKVEARQELVTVLANDQGLGEHTGQRLAEAIVIGREKPAIPELILEAI